MKKFVFLGVFVVLFGIGISVKAEGVSTPSIAIPTKHKRFDSEKEKKFLEEKTTKRKMLEVHWKEQGDGLKKLRADMQTFHDKIAKGSFKNK